MAAESVELTQEMVNGVTDLVDGTRLLKALNISTVGCKRVVDIVERLQLNYDIQRGLIVTPEKVSRIVCVQTCSYMYIHVHTCVCTCTCKNMLVHIHCACKAFETHDRYDPIQSSSTRRHSLKETSSLSCRWRRSLLISCVTTRRNLKSWCRCSPRCVDRCRAWTSSWSATCRTRTQ